MSTTYTLTICTDDLTRLAPIWEAAHTHLGAQVAAVVDVHETGLLLHIDDFADRAGEAGNREDPAGVALPSCPSPAPIADDADDEAVEDVDDDRDVCGASGAYNDDETGDPVRCDLLEGHAALGGSVAHRNSEYGVSWEDDSDGDDEDQDLDEEPEPEPAPVVPLHDSAWTDRSLPLAARLTSYLDAHPAGVFTVAQIMEHVAGSEGGIRSALSNLVRAGQITRPDLGQYSSTRAEAS